MTPWTSAFYYKPRLTKDLVDGNDVHVYINVCTSLTCVMVVNEHNYGTSYLHFQPSVVNMPGHGKHDLARKAVWFGNRKSNQM